MLSKMMKIDMFKVLVPAILVFTFCLQLCHCESYNQQNQQSNNGYQTSSPAPFFQYHHRNHPTRTSMSYPTESRTVVPLFLPMILFVGIVLLLFFAVVGSAAVAGGASGIGRHDAPTRFAFARDFSSSAALARSVLSSEQCVERISCEVFRVAKGYKAQNWILRALSFLPTQSNLTKRASRAIWAQSKPSRRRRSGRGNCLEFQCSTASSIFQAVKNLRAEN